MTGRWVLAVAVVVLVLLGLYLRGLAGRLDRLHVRVEAAADALDAQLLRRSGVALELAASGLLDPASSMLLASAAHGAQAAEPEDREEAESGLSQALRATLDAPEADTVLGSSETGRGLLEEAAAACRRVVLARRFHNDAVAATQRLRRHRLVRALHLAGSAPLPVMFECDDRAPACLARPA
jgi:hypothetical protein